MHRDEVSPSSPLNVSTSAATSSSSEAPTGRVPSLCAGWTVHDVLAHLVANTEETVLGLVKGLIRARGASTG